MHGVKQRIIPSLLRFITVAAIAPPLTLMLIRCRCCWRYATIRYIAIRHTVISEQLADATPLQPLLTSRCCSLLPLHTLRHMMPCRYAGFSWLIIAAASLRLLRRYALITLIVDYAAPAPLLAMMSFTLILPA